MDRIESMDADRLLKQAFDADCRLPTTKSWRSCYEDQLHNHLVSSPTEERERNCTTSIQPAWLMRTDLCSCLGHLQNGCEAMANSLLVLMPHEQTHGAFSILKQIGILSPDGTKARAVKNVMKHIANSLSVAKVAPTEMAGEAGPNKPALLNRQRM